MPLHMRPFFPLRKSIALWLLLSLSLPAASLPGAETSDTGDLRQQAVSQYIEGATRELAAIGQQISAAARPDNERQCSEAKAKLDECSALVADLKSADPQHFDLVKATYERTRGELVKALQAAQAK
jgi:hypothetical protein